MAEKPKNFAIPHPKNVKSKRQTMVGIPSSRMSIRVPSTAVKEKNPAVRPKINKNITLLGEGDITICKDNESSSSTTDFDALHCQMAYGKFLRTMLDDCLLDKKIEREETQMDIQMAQLADRFQKTMDLLDKTNRRLKDISFVTEQSRLLDLKNQDCSKFYEIIDKSDAQEILQDLSKREQSYLDRLETKNVDFGYDKETGHKQLLDAVNDAIIGLEQIKKHSNMDSDKFKEYDKSKKNMDELEKDRLDLESLKTEFETKFPKFSEKLIKEASEKIAKLIEADDDDDED